MRRRDVCFDLEPVPDCAIQCLICSYLGESAYALVQRLVVSAEKMLFVQKGKCRK